MPIGRPYSLSTNVATKKIIATATEGQKTFTVTGGYRVGELAVYRNGVRLTKSNDYAADNGSTVILVEGATEDDTLIFDVFDSFNVADAINANSSDITLKGNLTVNEKLTVSGISSFTDVVSSGIVTADSFYGDGSNLSGVSAGLEIKTEGNSAGTAVTALNFVGMSSVTGVSAGVVTATISQHMTVGVRVGTAVTFSFSGGTFNILAKGGGNIVIDA
tara:strand:+ start:484 stop:1137 length:654 start_codon:yes stop_codon:yes gene_type:complete